MENRTINDAIKEDLLHIKTLIDEIYFATHQTQPPWFLNKIITIDLMLSEIIKGDE